ncbi:MBL fold metallo-hydrolase [Acetobacteraceae bacterium]|nr:MBL fold metallo-hydrolase [Candidatus Parcubacteria bacterium]
MEKALKYRAYVALALLVFITLGIWAAVLQESKSGVLTVAVLTVGQGDSIYIQSPTGTEVVIDGGPDNSILRELPKVMRPFDRSLDAVIATHPDADHIAGFIDLLNRYSVKNFVEPGIAKDTVTAARLEEEITKNNIPRYKAVRGMTLDLGGGVQLRILSPDFEVSTLPESKANEGGIVAQLVYASTTMLLMADVSSKVEDHLVEIDGESAGFRIDSDILKVGHHGSRTSTDDELLDAVTPSVAIISVGAKNRYGHPTQDVLDRLSAHNVEVHRTDEEGTIKFISNGKQFTRVK